MTLSRQFQASLFFFTKRFWVNKKHQSAKQTTFTLLEVLCAKNCCLCYFLLACFCFLVGFGLICVFVRSKSFCKKKKKKNWLEIILIASFTILLTCTPLNLPIENLFVLTYFYLWSSVRIFFICENFFLFMIICVNLCFYEKKQV